MKNTKHYRLRKIGRVGTKGERVQVVDAHDDRHVLGHIYGSDATAYEAHLPGDDVALITEEPLTTVQDAAEHLYLLFLFTLTPTTTGDAS